MNRTKPEIHQKKGTQGTQITTASFEIFSDISSDISSDILSDNLFWHISDTSSDISSGSWGPALPTPVGRSRVSSGVAHSAPETPRLRSGIAQSAPELPGWGPALPTAIWGSLLGCGAAHCNLEFVIEVRRCPLQSGGPCCILAKMTARRKCWRLAATEVGDANRDGEYI